jgi:hypothetical protein
MSLNINKVKRLAFLQIIRLEARLDKPKVAVIAIHGVGEHKPDATSALVAAQLQHFFPASFKVFECTPLHIAVDTASLPIPPHAGHTTQPHGARMPKSVSARAISDLPQQNNMPGDIAFTGITLAGGQGYTASYSTIRLRCEIDGQGGIDLYDMFWSDLSHGGTQGGLRLLREMLQLFLHMACLGRAALSTLLAALGPHPARSRLTHAYAASAWGYWILAVPIALGNLLLLCLGAALLGLLVPDNTAGRAGTAIAVAILVATLAGAAWRWRMRNATVLAAEERMGLPLVWLAMLAIPAIYFLWREIWSMRPADVAFLPALALAIAAGTVVALRYEVSRPSVMIWWRTLLAFCVLWWIAAVVKQRENPPIQWLDILAFMAEGSFVWLVVWWSLLAFTNLFLLATGTRAKRAHPSDEAVRRAVNTSLVAAAVPASLLLIVVLTLWLGIKHVLDPSKFTLMYHTVDLWFFHWLTVEELIGAFIDLSAGRAAMFFLLFMMATLAGVVIALLPSVVAELFPPEKAADDAHSRALWRWLDQGFRLLPTGKWLTVIAFFILLPAGSLWLHLAGNTGLTLPDVGATVGVGALAFVSVTRLFAATSLSGVSRAFARTRVAIDTAIDVDNWLRERPIGRTPRLRIMARYVSLLRHLQQQGYKRIVVVGHSQGTVITVDLLRYLKAHKAPLLEQLGPIDLLTFGSPLRQLYAARFPALYGWIANPPGEARREARLYSWTNGYGSGDYVGRNLWDRAAPAQPWQCGRNVDPIEFCTGALAHTHYFDESAPDVAAAIHDAIANALAAVQPPPPP